MKPTLTLTLCLALLLPAAAQARDRRERGGCSVVVEVLAAPFAWLGLVARPAPVICAPAYAPTYGPGYAPAYAPARRYYANDTDYMLRR